MAASAAWTQLALSALLGPISGDNTQAAQGVLAGPNNPALVTETSGAPSQAVTIREAAYIVGGSSPSASGLSVWTPGQDVTLNLVAPPNSSNPRIDVLTVQQTDPGSVSTPILYDFVWVQGTAAASPSKPSIPSGALELYSVAVPSGAGSNITNAMLTDNRVYVGVRGSVWNVPTRAKIASGALYAGLECFEQSTGQHLVYTGSNGWVPLLGAGSTPAFMARQTITSGAVVGVNVATNTDGIMRFGFVVLNSTIAVSGTGNSRFTPQVKGWYWCNARGSWPVNGTGYRYMWLMRNGTEVESGGDVQPGHSSIEVSNEIPDTLVYFNGTTDYLEVGIRQNSTVTLSMGNNLLPRLAAHVAIKPALLGV